LTAGFRLDVAVALLLAAATRGFAVDLRFLAALGCVFGAALTAFALGFVLFFALDAFFAVGMPPESTPICRRAPALERSTSSSA
jgi:hypothetical protein